MIAEHMARAHREVPAVTWVEECDFEASPLETLLASVVKACAESLAEFPELNARFDGDSIVYLDRYDIGVAVQTDAGLVVAVVRGADAKSARGGRRRDPPASPRARAAGSLQPDEVRGSTFTVTSAGKLAGLLQTPIVNHPRSRSSASAGSRRAPVVRDGEVVVRRTGHDRGVLRPPRGGRRARRRVRARRDPPARSAAKAKRRGRGRRTARRRTRRRSSRPRARRISGPESAAVSVYVARSRRRRRRTPRRRACSGATGRRTTSGRRSRCRSSPSASPRADDSVDDRAAVTTTGASGGPETKPVGRGRVIAVQPVASCHVHPQRRGEVALHDRVGRGGRVGDRVCSPSRARRSAPTGT